MSVYGRLPSAYLLLLESSSRASCIPKGPWAAPPLLTVAGACDRGEPGRAANGEPMSSRPQATPHVHISEPHVRVTEWRFAPGAETGWHRHEADYVVVPMLDGDLLLE